MRAFGGPCWGAAPEGSGRQKRGEGWPGCPVRGDSARCGASQVTIATPLPYTPKTKLTQQAETEKPSLGLPFQTPGGKRPGSRVTGTAFVSARSTVRGCSEEGMLEHGPGWGWGCCRGMLGTDHPAASRPPSQGRNREGKRTGEQKSARGCRVTVT